MAANSNNCGYAITVQNLFSELGLAQTPPCKQSFSNARKKLSFEAFSFLLQEANQEQQIEDLWHGHVVRILDGSKINLPSSKELRAHFARPNSKAGPAHYPQALIVTALNSFSGQPVAVEMGCYKKSNERDLALRLMNNFNDGDLSLLDRGLGGKRVYLQYYKHNQFFIHRERTFGSTAPLYIQDFIKAKKRQTLTAVDVEDDDGEIISILVRLVKGPIDSEGNRIVFVTNLLDEKEYASQSIVELYKRRWGIETTYGRVKNLLNLELFHSRSLNGIKQEIYANLLILSLTALIECQASKKCGLDRARAVPNFKAATHVVRRHLATIIGSHKLSQKEATLAAEKMIEEASRIIWRKQPGRNFPRVSMQSINVWSLCKNRKLAAAAQSRRRRRQA